MPDSDLASTRLHSWPCPSCGENVPRALIDADIALPGRPKKQYVTCPSCSETLMREPEHDNANLRGWRQRAKPPATLPPSTM